LRPRSEMFMWPLAAALLLALLASAQTGRRAEASA
jgi:hypothetical protein